MKYMFEDAVSKVLQSISNPIRRSIIEVLVSRSEPFVFSELMRECGLNPNFDAGHFSYHLSVLLDQNIVSKNGNRYSSTELGLKLSNIIKTLNEECEFFLKEKESKTENEVIDFETKWAKKKDWVKYGIALASFPEDEEEKILKFRFKNEYIVATRNEETLGWMWVGTAVGADLKQRRLLTPIRNEADIKEIVLFVTGKERARVAKKMIETFFVVALKKGATLVTANADADDEELVSVLKSFGFERTSIVYKMNKKL